ncbi:unnamed protein product [Cyprideis torosa]|uniref:Uncharacterized protein n=1 Tax=Cyprideis torosa TaxID=163714 RepID=A0A7R8WFM7_9CRUS|nr:unnamed protein product [Cyprideis torosa]CAG0891114.1 unnamed protein product [Cyprideis torosa]
MAKRRITATAPELMEDRLQARLLRYSVKGQEFEPQAIKESTGRLFLFSHRLQKSFELMFYRVGLVVSLHPRKFIFVSLFLCLVFMPGMLFYREVSTEKSEAWFPRDHIYSRTETWIQEHFPDGIRYEIVVVAAPNVLHSDVIRFVSQLERRIREAAAGDVDWQAVCARPTEFLNGMTSKRRRKRQASSNASVEEQPASIGENATVGAAPVLEFTNHEEEEDDYYGDYGGMDLGGVQEMEEMFAVAGGGLEDECISSSILELWESLEDAGNATTGEILDKVTAAYKDGQGLKTVTDLQFILSPPRVHPAHPQEVIGADALIVTYFLRQNATARDRFGNVHDYDAENWETAFIDAVRNNDLEPPDGVRVYPFAKRSYMDAINENVVSNLPLLFLGFLLILVYVFVMLGRFNLYQHRLYLAIAGVVVVGLAVVNVFGIGSYIGIRFTSLAVVVPFLVLGVGIDDLFVIVQSLDNLEDVDGLPVEKRIALCMSHAGVAITITSFTDIVGFAFGAFSPLPVLSSICQTASMGILMVYIMQLTIIVPILFLDEKRRESRKDARFVSAFKEHFPDNGERAEMYIGRLNYVEEKENLDQLFRRLSSLSVVKNGSVDFWFHAFEDWLQSKDESFPKTEPEFKARLRTFLTETKRGRMFLKDIQYTGNLLDDYNITASRAHLQHTNLNTTHLQRHALLMLEEIITTTNFTAEGSEQYLGFYGELYLSWYALDLIAAPLLRNIIITSIAVFVFSLVLIGDLRVAIFVFICVALTLTNIAGSMYFMGLTIEILTSAFIVLSVGLAVDYSSHIGHAFMVSPGYTKNEKCQDAVGKLGAAVFNGGFSTFLSFIVSPLTDNYIFTAAFQVITLVVFYGLFHGLLFLPVMLSFFGPPPLSKPPKPIVQQVEKKIPFVEEQRRYVQRAKAMSTAFGPRLVAKARKISGTVTFGAPVTKLYYTKDPFPSYGGDANPRERSRKGAVFKRAVSTDSIPPDLVTDAHWERNNNKPKRSTTVLKRAEHRRHSRH